jgi:biopolymer transport protein ExbD
MQTRIHVAAPEQHGIDLAPMLDFVVNLLIFFIITAVFVKESGIVLNRSTGGTPIDEGPPAVMIRLAANGDIYVDDRRVDPNAVRANVERMKSVDPARGVVIVADATAPTGALVDVADQVRRAGIYDVTFNTQE